MRLIARLRGAFLTGLAVVLPVGLTVMLLLWAVDVVDRNTAPLAPTQIAGLGFVVFVALTILTGMLTKGLIGRAFLTRGEALVGHVPLVRSVYTGLKQLVETVLSKGGTTFRQTCLVEFPERGMWSLAFISGPAEGEVPEKAGQSDMVAVLVVNAPNPMTGLLLFVPRRDIRPLGISFEEGAKLAMSAGAVGPKSR